MSVIYLEEFKKLKKKKSRYPLKGNNGEILTSNDVDEFVKQGKWTGTYTPQAPYHDSKKEGDDEV